MGKEYIDTPHNFGEIEAYVITDIENIKREMILAKKCYFYDTCSFRNHMMTPDAKLLYKYIIETFGIVVITRTVLMELCSNNGCLWNEHIEYIKNMNLMGIKILIIYEEDIFDILHSYCADVSQINKWLSFAVKIAKSKVGKIEAVIEQNIDFKKALFEGEGSKDNKLAEKMFKCVRERKTSGDNMGEELLAICVHWLSRMRDIEEYKYVILTDDKKSIPIFGKVIKNVKDYSDFNSISLCTTVKLCYLMKINNIICEENQIIRILSYTNSGINLKVYCSEEFELNPAEKNMSIQEFAGKVFGGKIKVYY